MGRRLLIPLLACVLMGASLAACAAPQPKPSQVASADLAGYPALEAQLWPALAGYEGQPAFRELTVKDVVSLMEQGESFALFCAFPECPWCSLMIGELSDAARDAGIEVALINTRKDPSWKSNLDIDDYDLFVEAFGSMLDEDDEGVPHLYVPDLYIIRDGKPITHHQGVLPELDDPAQPLSDAQRQELRSLIDGLLAELAR